jgi:hypothetical protein
MAVSPFSGAAIAPHTLQIKASVKIFGEYQP